MLRFAFPKCTLGTKHIAIATLIVMGAIPFLSSTSAPAKPIQTKERVHNPYCNIPTYSTTQLTGPARAMLRDGKSPLILLNRSQINKSGLTDFFLAHECCHHKLGHLKKRPGPIAAINGRAVTKVYAKMEADADCCAAKILTYYDNKTAIDKAKVFMSRFGRVPTGFGYPTGVARYGAIESCRLRAEKEFGKNKK